MESLRDIRQNIKSINSIKQVMLTMKMISSARIKRAQQAMADARPFALKMEEMVDDLGSDLIHKADLLAEGNLYGLFSKTPLNADKAGLVLITADKGLCGAFNALTLKTAVAWFKENKEKQISVFCIGKKGRDFIKRIKMPNINVVYEAVGIFPKAGYVHADMLAKSIMENYLSAGLGSIRIIYNNFTSVAKQEIVNQQLLPFDFEKIKQEKEEQDFLYEPGIEQMFKMLFSRYLGATMYRILLESQAAELAARMNAMDSAGKNASDLASSLAIKLNKVRQEMITNEISEIVSGANALNN